jgi:hypothetical protein
MPGGEMRRRRRRISLVAVTVPRSIATCAALIAALSLSGCKKTSTSPSSGAPSGTPVILGTVPSQPSLSQLPQTLLVNGHDFDLGLTATLLRPDGRSTAFINSELRQLTTSSFQISAVLDLAGEYQLEVRNQGGQVSAPFTLRVGGAAQGVLTLTSVTPSFFFRSTSPQAIFVSGTNFDNTLEAILTAPDSVMNFYPATAMTGLNSTSFSLNVVFDRRGTYTLVVRNSSNSTSNPLTIEVQ